MNIFELILTGISLAMDAFTISICKGLVNPRKKHGFIISFFFGFFQFIMPIIGFYIGNVFSEKIIYYNPFISMILLITIGILMIKEKNDNFLANKLKFFELIMLSIATSIDALIVGISFSFLKNNIFTSSIIIGSITFILCFIGYFLGNLLNKKISCYANIIGGITLILIALKIFIQTIIHL